MERNSKSKNANGEGTIRQRKRDGLHEARVTMPDGRQRSLYGHTREEARRKLTAALRARDQGLPPARSERQTTAQYLTAWLEMVRPRVKPKTYLSYEVITRVHLLPGLGRVPLAKLTPQHVQTLQAQTLSAGRSPTTVRHIHAVLHKALSDAVRLDAIPRNVCELVDPPRAAAHATMCVLTPEQVRILLEAARGDRLEALYVLALTTGMREGELLALRWSAVELQRAQPTLQVRSTLTYTPQTGYVFGEPKTKRSRRQIALPRATAEALRAHRTRQLEERLALGEAWDDMDLVFCSRVGTPIDQSNLLRQQFRPLLRRASLPRIRFHDLRHTAATLLLGQGINPKIVSELLGHASVAITLDLYSHVLPDMQQQAAAAMDVVLGF